MRRQVLWTTTLNVNCANLQKWAEGHAVLFTHRLSSIKSSDLILVMNDGSLVEQARIQNCLPRERYAALYQQQGE